jgi:hypothetical protein
MEPPLIKIKGRNQEISSNISFDTPQTGQTQSSGISSKGVPAAMPLSGSPVSGLYIHPQIKHLYFFNENTPLPYAIAKSGIDNLK